MSRRFVCGTKKALEELLSRDLADLDPVVVMIDGTDFAGATVRGIDDRDRREQSPGRVTAR